MKEPRKFKRATRAGAIYNITHDCFELDGVWAQVLGEPEKNGAWIIYGPEKNGKTWLALMLANYLSSLTKVHYISAEEGTSKGFVDCCIRARIEPNNRSLYFVEYEPISELKARLNSRNAPGIVFIDNLTIYSDELNSKAFKELLDDHPHTLFIFLAHEERGLPYTAVAKLCKRLSKIIFRVQALTCIVEGRCPGGRVLIDENQAALYHGQSII